MHAGSCPGRIPVLDRRCLLPLPTSRPGLTVRQTGPAVNDRSAHNAKIAPVCPSPCNGATSAESQADRLRLRGNFRPSSLTAASHPLLTDRPQRQLDGVARGGPQRVQPLITPGEPLPKALLAPLARRPWHPASCATRA